MTRTISILAASAVLLLPAVAHGQAAPAVGGGPAAGSTDASRAARDTNAVREEYNRLAGSQNRKKKGKTMTAVPATAADVVAGKTVSSLKGETLGTDETVEADGAVVATAKGKVKIPLEGFGRTDQGLVLAISKEEFEEAVVSAHITKPLS